MPLEMRSPKTLAAKLSKDWKRGDVRERRLLNPEAWPVILRIGEPSAEQFTHHNTEVQLHINAWREVEIGQVIWQNIKYRSADTPVSIPVKWQLQRPSEWIAATEDPKVRDEYARLALLMRDLDPLFHSLIIRQRQLQLSTPDSEIILASRVALDLRPGYARGRPLRMLSLHGIDSKFLERNQNLMCRMLNLRFQHKVSAMGLETFLDAYNESEHWLLIVPLAEGVLPFRQLRLRSSELLATSLPSSNILLVENEKSLHQLPQVEDCIAILGSGFDLKWLQAQWLREKQIAYWGDIDSWGLAMLATARHHQPHLQSLLMKAEIFETYQDRSAVIEPQCYGPSPPEELTDDENKLYLQLLQCERNRLEQEFIPPSHVHRAVADWMMSANGLPEKVKHDKSSEII